MQKRETLLFKNYKVLDSSTKGVKNTRNMIMQLLKFIIVLQTHYRNIGDQEKFRFETGYGASCKRRGCKVTLSCKIIARRIRYALVLSHNLQNHNYFQNVEELYEN